MASGPRGTPGSPLASHVTAWARRGDGMRVRLDSGGKRALASGSERETGRMAAVETAPADDPLLQDLPPARPAEPGPVDAACRVTYDSGRPLGPDRTLSLAGGVEL